MRARLLSALCLSFPIALGAGLPAAARADGDRPTATTVAAALGFDEAAIGAAKAGEIVSRPIAESSRSEIGAVVAMIVEAPMARISRHALRAGFAELDPSLLAHGRIETPATAASFAGLRLPPAELDRFARARAGTDLNLATEEIAALTTAAASRPEGAGDVLRELLAARVEAYRQAGRAGPSPPSRAPGGRSNPRRGPPSARPAQTVLARFAPDFHAALGRYPQGVPARFEDRYYWALVDVQDRPTVVLIHRLVDPAGDVEIVAEQHFYVSQGYNALQIVVGLFPLERGTAVIYTNRTHSDQAARFGRMAQSIGRRMLVDEVTRFFAAAQEAVGN